MADNATQYDFFGEGGVADSPLAPGDPNDQPNPANPGGISNNELMRRQRALRDPTYRVPENRPGAALGYTTDSNGNRITIRADNFPGESEGIAAQMGTVSRTPSVGSQQTGDLFFTPPAAPAPQAGQSPLVQEQLGKGDALVDQALATEPTVAPENAVTPENIARLTPVVDPALSQDANTKQALAMSQDLVDRILGTPLQTQQLADASLSNQLAVARSARGGAGAVQDSLNQAQSMAPELLRTASQQSIEEQVRRAGAAGQAASIFAGVANQGADRAVNIATANQGAGLAVMNNLTTLTGFDYQFDQAKMAIVGQLARDYFQNAQAFAGMDTQMQITQWNNAVAAYGIDRQFDAAVKKIAADENIGPFDAFKLVLGGVSGATGLAAL